MIGIHSMMVFTQHYLSSYPPSPPPPPPLSEMDTDGISGADTDSRHYWDSFQNLVQLMRSLSLLECFTAHAVTVVVQEKVVL